MTARRKADVASTPAAPEAPNEVALLVAIERAREAVSRLKVDASFTAGDLAERRRELAAAGREAGTNLGPRAHLQAQVAGAQATHAAKVDAHTAAAFELNRLEGEFVALQLDLERDLRAAVAVAESALAAADQAWNATDDALAARRAALADTEAAGAWTQVVTAREAVDQRALDHRRATARAQAAKATLAAAERALVQARHDRLRAAADAEQAAADRAAATLDTTVRGLRAQIVAHQAAATVARAAAAATKPPASLARTG